MLEEENVDDVFNETPPTLSDEERFADTTVNRSSDSLFRLLGSGSSLYVPHPSISNKSVTPRKGRRREVQKRTEKCLICGAKLGTQKGLENHVLNHKLEDAASRKPSEDQLRRRCLYDACIVVSEMEKSPRSKLLSGNDFSDFAAKVSDCAIPEPNDLFCQFVEVCVENLVKPLCFSRIVSPSSIRSKVRVALHGALVNPDVRNSRLEKLVSLVDNDVTSSVCEQYLEEFCRRLGHSVAAFMVNLMRQAPDDEHLIKCRSKDNFDELFSQQSLYNVVGYSVKAVLGRCRRNRTSQRYCDIQRLVLNKFARIGTMEARPEEPSFWSALLARKAYTFVSEPAFNFFVEVAKVLCYVETETGSIPKKEVVRIVTTSPSLVAQWGTLVGRSLTENDSHFLMRLLVLSLCGSFGRGISLRRTNAEAKQHKQGVKSAGLRARLTK